MRAWLRAKRHALAHRLGWTTGTVVAWWGPCGRLWVGFKCAHCGDVTGAHMPRQRSIRLATLYWFEK